MNIQKIDPCRNRGRNNSNLKIYTYDMAKVGLKQKRPTNKGRSNL